MENNVNELFDVLHAGFWCYCYVYSEVHLLSCVGLEAANHTMIQDQDKCDQV